MSLQITFHDQPDHLLCVATGNAARGALFALADRIWRECDAKAGASVLVDVSGITGDGLSTMETNDLGLYCAGKPRRVRRLAVVGCASANDLHFENVVNNRGLQTRLWADRPSAQDWLRAAA